MIGSQLSHYIIESELGRGGMGIVYRARDTKLDRSVAIKVLPSAALTSEDDRTRFYREAKAAAALTHPHIAIIHGVDEAVPDGSNSDDVRPFIAMEFIDGETLEERIKRGPLNLEDAVRIASEIASALKLAHENEIVHRDIKSANVMLTKDDTAKVLDFGLAQTAQSTKLTRMGSTLGTVAYMSPEQARGEQVDGRTDLYSLGTILYEMIAGRMPFSAEYEQAAIYSILNEDPEPLTALRSGVPLELEALVFKALRKDRETRYQSASDLIADLKSVNLSAATQTSIRTSTITTEIRSPDQTIDQENRKNRHLLTIGLAIVGMIATFMVGYFIASNTSTQQYGSAIRATETIPGLISGSVSPSGEHLMYVADDTLWVRRLASETINPIATFEQSARWHFWSHDSQRIGFVDGDVIRSIRTDGSSEIRIGRIPPSERIQGAIWTPQDSVLIVVGYGGANHEIVSFPASGGNYTSWLKLSAAAGDYMIFDLALHEDSGQIIAATRESHESKDLQSSIRILKAEGTAFQEADEALQAITQSDEGYARLSYDSAGHLILSRQGMLWILDVDPKTLVPLNPPRVLASGVLSASLAQSGLLVGMMDREPRSLDFIAYDDDSGNSTVIKSIEKRLTYFAARPTGDQIAAVDGDGMHVIDMQRGDMRRINDRVNGNGDWLPQDVGIFGSVYSGTTGGADIYLIDPDGVDPPKVFIDRDESAFYPSLSPDESTLMWYETSPDTGRDLWTIPVEISEGEINITGEAELWFAGSNDDVHPDWHASGNWILYASNHTGEYRIYLREYPSARNERLVSIGSGFDPTWNEDGTKIFYRNEKSFFAVDVLDGETMRLSRPREILDIEGDRIGVQDPLYRSYTVNPVTGELLLNQFRGDREEPGLVFISNWKALLAED